MLSIHLHNLLFVCTHGVYEAEYAVNNKFEVNIDVSYLPEQRIINSLSETINYASIYTITKKIMLQHTPLLETLAMDIAYNIQAAFSNIVTINVSIKKLHPPIPAFIGSVGVSFTLKNA